MTVKLNGEDRAMFLPNGIIGGPYCLAIDWLARNLYYGNVLTSTVEVCFPSPAPVI